MTDKKISSLLDNWQKRNIAGLFFKDRKSALDKILEIIPVSASVGISGSVTLDELGIAKLL
ncbi:MAG: LUD domain-containing protein, partial [Candidatus Omnitrophica bacterium]|nr:LUD domain-containing protein [Candidatus Omnitrophota bacterium]